MMENNVFKYSQSLTDLVDSMNKELLAKRTLSTNPDMLQYHSYDAYNITLNTTPPDSIARFTIDGLKHIFPLLKIVLGPMDTIFVEDKLVEGFSAVPPNGDEHPDHINYIKEIMLDIFTIYKDDEEKIPKNLYKWYFKED